MAFIKPKLPDGASYDGQILFPTTDIEIDDDLKRFVRSVDYRIHPQFQIKETGFQKKKYRTRDSSCRTFSIMLVGNLPFHWHQQLIGLAIAVNSSGMIIEFEDSFVTGEEGNTVTYDCRWVNAGDFVDNNELLFGGTIELETYTLPEDQGRYAVPGVPDNDFQEVIDNPASGFDFQEVINDVDADVIYYEVI